MGDKTSSTKHIELQISIKNIIGDDSFDFKLGIKAMKNQHINGNFNNHK